MKKAMGIDESSSRSLDNLANAAAEDVMSKKRTLQSAAEDLVNYMNNEKEKSPEEKEI